MHYGNYIVPLILKTIMKGEKLYCLSNILSFNTLQESPSLCPSSHQLTLNMAFSTRHLRRQHLRCTDEYEFVDSPQQQRYCQSPSPSHYPIDDDDSPYDLSNPQSDFAKFLFLSGDDDDQMKNLSTTKSGFYAMALEPLRYGVNES